MMKYLYSAILAASVAVVPAAAQTGGPSDSARMYTMQPGAQSRWTSPENHSGAKGQGAKANNGIKGHAYDQIPAHGHADVLNIDGPGIIQRMKMSVIDRSPEALRSLRIEMYWDGADKPAVRAPLGDFFGTAFGKTAEYETSLFKDPEGRSFTFTIPMPFKKGARIVIYNDSDKPVTHLYYNVNFQKLDKPPEDMLYFHAYWRRNTPAVGKDFVVLPEVKGSGRFLGASIGVKADPVYGRHKEGEPPLNYWWGEGEVKLWLDGDKQDPSMVGTGVEDYFGTAWGMAHFVTMNSGCTIADPDTLHWSCYRYHVPDPIWFHQDIKVAMQQIGGGPLEQVRQLRRDGAPLKVISVDAKNGKFYPLLSMKNPPQLMDDDFPKGWTNYFRSDDWCATAYFYLDTPTDNLPELAPVETRLRDL
ncbi:glycoside hydrolase family 172 protein [Stakelama saccharophila]|uniref:Glycoside hydrolase family 172 protein n=1 Tax=Stakelama saccharophila TaxID=3075605 RepID=A0ABZ0B523_9SPHN|nr:glycoside hydrolase family 172 protein [Stakelama sp. W311]WNO52425.1 glycoside hydrolase family 172 protein [Stakelama sp. W311]